jgi:hypothetical protein
MQVGQSNTTNVSTVREDNLNNGKTVKDPAVIPDPVVVANPAKDEPQVDISPQSFSEMATQPQQPQAQPSRATGDGVTILTLETWVNNGKPHGEKVAEWINQPSLAPDATVIHNYARDTNYDGVESPEEVAAHNQEVFENP